MSGDAFAGGPESPSGLFVERLRCCTNDLAVVQILTRHALHLRARRAVQRRARALRWSLIVHTDVDAHSFLSLSFRKQNLCIENKGNPVIPDTALFVVLLPII